MNSSEFADKIRSKYPGAYDDMDDNTLTQKVLAKYPQYQDMVDESPSKLGSFARGVMSGVPGAETAVSGIESALTPKTYQESHQGLEDLKNKDWETNPVSYGAGKATGIVGTSLIAPEVEGLAGAAGVGAGIGALAGADAASKPSDIPLEALKGAPTGAAMGAVGHGIVSGLGKAIPAISKSLVANLGNKTTVPGVEAYLDNPGAINSALSKTQIGEKLTDLTSDIGKASGHLSENARGLLDPGNTALTAKGLKDIAMDTMDKYFTEGNIATDADATAVKTILSQYQKLAQIAQDNGGTVPEDTLRAMVDRLQAATKSSTFGNPEASTSQTAIKEFSGKLNDALRSANPDYAEGMQPSADLAKLSGAAKEQFSLKPNFEGDLAPSDATVGKIGNVLKEGKTQGSDILDQIKNATGQDLQDMIQKSDIQSSFNEPGPGSATKTLLATLGFGAGKMSGIPFGGIGGAAVGRYAAEGVNGGNVAKGILDFYLKGTNSPMGKIAAKFGPVLVNAAKTGGNELAATHFVLATSNPEYQALAEHVQGNNQ